MVFSRLLKTRRFHFAVAVVIVSAAVVNYYRAQLGESFASSVVPSLEPSALEIIKEKGARVIREDLGELVCNPGLVEEKRAALLADIWRSSEPLPRDLPCEVTRLRCYGLHSDRTFGVIWTELSSQFGSFITPTIRSFPAPRLPQAAPRLLYPAPRFFAKTSYPALPRPFFRPVAWFSWFDGVPGVEVPRMKWCVREFAAPKKNSRRFMSS